MDRDERRQFVREHRTAVFGYGRKDDGPAMTVVYYVMDGDDILVSTMADRQKARACVRNPRVSLCVLDEKFPLQYVQVYGDAVVDDDPAHAADMLVKVFERVSGNAMPPQGREKVGLQAKEEHRIVVRVTPYSTFATPPKPTDGTQSADDSVVSGTLPW